MLFWTSIRAGKELDWGGMNEPRRTAASWCRNIHNHAHARDPHEKPERCLQHLHTLKGSVQHMQAPNRCI